jgi:hypothetical protein
MNTTETIVLSNSAAHRNPFESGNVDKFEIKAPYLGQIKKIK